jgi:hypothetical protein
MTKPNTENKQVLQLLASNEEEQAKNLARVIASPSVNAARLQLVFNPNQGLELGACVDNMKEQITQLKQGGTVRIEPLLLAQGLLTCQLPH